MSAEAEVSVSLQLELQVLLRIKLSLLGELSVTRPSLQSLDSNHRKVTLLLSFLLPDLPIEKAGPGAGRPFGAL